MLVSTFLEQFDIAIELLIGLFLGADVVSGYSQNLLQGGYFLSDDVSQHHFLGHAYLGFVEGIDLLSPKFVQTHQFLCLVLEYSILWGQSHA